MIKKLKKKWNSMESDDRILLVGMAGIGAWCCLAGLIGSIIGTTVATNRIIKKGVNFEIENKFIARDGTETVIK